jgi:hypothetical protein
MNTVAHKVMAILLSEDSQASVRKVYIKKREKRGGILNSMQNPILLEW